MSAFRLCLMLLVAWPAFGQVSPASPEAERAQSEIDAGEFEDAVKTLELGLKQPDLSEEQQIELYRLLGLAHLYLGNDSQARDALKRLLHARPDYSLPKSTPPKVQALFNRIKDDFKRSRSGPVTIAYERVPESAGGAPSHHFAKITDLPPGAKARLYYRRAGSQPFSSVDFAKAQGSADQFRATIPGFELPAEDRGYMMEYYLEVEDAGRRRLAGRGDAYNPLKFQVLAIPGAADKPVVEANRWYKNPWIWAGVGAVAAGATTGIVIAATSRPTGSLPITIQVEP